MVKKLLVFLFFLLLIYSSLHFSRQSFASTFPALPIDSSHTLLPIGQGQCNITYTEVTSGMKGCISTVQAPSQCRPLPGQGNICQEPPAAGSIQNGSFCYTDTECSSGYCMHPAGSIGTATCQNKCNPNTCNGSCIVTTQYLDYPFNPMWSPSGYPQDTNKCVLAAPTPTPTPSSGGTASRPLTNGNLDCSTPSNKPGGCDCTENPQCASNLCQTATSTGRSTTRKTCSYVANAPSPTLTQCERNPNNPNCQSTRPLTCDPVKDEMINQADYDLWLKEYTHQVNTTLTSCFVPGNNTVNILDFQVWKDISYGLKQSF